MKTEFTNEELKYIAESCVCDYFNRFQELDYSANIGSKRGGGIKTDAKGTCYLAKLEDLSDILNLYVLRENAYSEVTDDTIVDIKQAIIRIFCYGCYYISRDEDNEIDLIVPLIPTGTRKHCMACHFIDPCVLHNNYGSYARIAGIMHSIEKAMVRDLSLETAMMVVSAQQRDKFMNKVLSEIVGEGNFVFVDKYKMYPFNTTVNFDKLRSFRSKKQQKKYMNMISDAFEEAVEGAFTHWAFVGDDDAVHLDDIVVHEVE